MIRTSSILSLILLASASSGCAPIADHMIDFEMGTRNHILSQQGWNEWSWCYEELEFPYHFAKGFKAGYRDILSGGKGCQPTLPPRCYWKPQHQSPEGRCKIMAWFDGFSHGALAAQQDGFGNLNAIPLSPTARANMISKEAPISQEVYDKMFGVSSAGEIPQPVPSAAETGAVSIGDPAIPVPPADGGPDLAVPVRPYDEE